MPWNTLNCHKLFQTCAVGLTDKDSCCPVYQDLKPTVYLVGDGHKPLFYPSNPGIRNFFLQLAGEGRLHVHVETGPGSELDALPAEFKGLLVGKAHGWEPPFFIDGTLLSFSEKILSELGGLNEASFVFCCQKLNELVKLANEIGSDFVEEVSVAEQVMENDYGYYQEGVRTLEDLSKLSLDVYNMTMKWRTHASVQRTIGFNITNKINEIDKHEDKPVIHYVSIGNAHLIENPIHNYIELKERVGLREVW